MSRDVSESLEPGIKPLREQWERGLEVLTELPSEFGDQLLVVLVDLKGWYNCHRYFCMRSGSGWEVSVDASNVPAKTAFRWLSDPRALTEKEQGRS